MGEVPGEIPDYLKNGTMWRSSGNGTTEEKIDKDTEWFRRDLWNSGEIGENWSKYKTTIGHQRLRENGVETGLENEPLPETATLRKFWEGIKNGVFEPMTESEAYEIAREQLEKHPHLSPLTVAESERIVKDFADNIYDRTTRDKLTSIEIKTIDTLYKDPVEGKKIVEELKKPDSDIVRNLESQGIRSFFDSAKNKLGDFEAYDSYGYTEEYFDSLMSEIRQKTGRQNIRMLDIGGASGKALFEVKQHDPAIETFNITVDEEPSMFPVDHMIVCPVESMPKELEESIDFAVSRTTWRYFTYPDIAIRNTVRALSIEGRADIYVIFTRSSLKSAEEGKAELNERIKSVFSELRKLEEEGYIETNLEDEDFEGIDIDTDGFLRITKKKSIKEVQF